MLEPEADPDALPQGLMRYIDQACKEAVKGSSFVHFRDRYRELPVVLLPIEGLLYRPENGRIISQLHARLDEMDVSPEAFIASQKESWVQNELHDLLLSLSRDERGPIYQELKTQAQQTEPLLITRDAVVVNGNRRLAAMRELYKLDAQAYAHFAQVRVAVLPKETTTADIEFVESALQLAPETKLAYTWINRRLKLRRQRDELKLPVKEIIASYRLPDKKAIQTELAELALAEEYLSNYCHAPAAYDLIEDAEALFKGLQSTLSEVDKVQAGKLWRWAGFAMIYARKQVGTKLLNYFPFTPVKPAWIPEEAMRRFAEQEGFFESAEETLTPRVEAQLDALLLDRAAAQPVALQLVDILDQVRIDANWKETPKKLLQHVQQARKLAERLESGRLTASQKAQIGSELAAIEHHSRRWLEDWQDAPAPVSRTRLRWRKLWKSPHRFCAESRNPVLRKIAGWIPKSRR